MQFRLTQLFTPLGRTRKALPVAKTRMKNGYLICPSLAIIPAAWGGASYVVAVLSTPFTSPFTFTNPPAVQSLGFVAAIKWVVGTDVVRYKLWTTGTEILPAPLYTGQVIPAGAIIEIWCVQGSAISIGSWRIQIGQVMLPETACDFTDFPAGTTVACVPGEQSTLDGLFLTCKL